MFEFLPVRYHRVQWGETLATVAKLFYNDPDKALVIYQHNKAYIANPNVIYPGQNLAIPYLDHKHDGE